MANTFFEALSKIIIQRGAIELYLTIPSLILVSIELL
jgi:hypothetical protein